MIKKKPFSFSMKVETTIKVEEVKNTDPVKKRHIKQLVNAFDNDPEALNSLIMINFIDFYCGDYREELDPILGKHEAEKSIILRVAQKCPPDACRYFSGLFGDGSANKRVPGNKDAERTLAAVPGEEPIPVEGKNEREFAREYEADWVFGELLERLCRFVLVNAEFSELPQQKMKPPLKRGKPKFKKGRLDRTFKKTNYQPITRPN